MKFIARIAKHYFIAGGLMAVIGIDCNNRKVYPDTFEYYKAKYAGAIRHYSNPKDSLKLKSLLFLLKSAGDQYYLTGQLVNHYNETIVKAKNKSLSFLASSLDSLGNLYSYNYTKIKDEDVLTDSFFINTVDDAFIAWGHKWNKNITFSQFCEYILPYKVGNEQPEYWKPEVAKDFSHLMDSLKDESDPIKVTAAINNRLNWFRGTLNYEYPVDMGYQMTKLVAAGTCNTGSRLVIYPMRYFGLPVVIDYAPAWGNRTSGHFWNALMINDRPYPFDSEGPNIGYYKIEFKGVQRIDYKIAKVFRKTYAVQKNSLAVIDSISEEMPAIFNSKRIKDVTEQYVPVSDVTVNFCPLNTKRYAYLSVFDNRNWIPIYWGRINNCKVEYDQMGRDIVYLPSMIENGVLKPITSPFILDKDGKVRVLRIDTLTHQNIIAARKYPEDESNLIDAGDKYELLYWNERWKSLGIQVAIQKSLIFKDAPSNTLFWLRDLTKGNQERIFTYEHGNQIWW